MTLTTQTKVGKAIAARVFAAAIVSVSVLVPGGTAQGGGVGGIPPGLSVRADLTLTELVAAPAVP